ncbi:toll-like receptor 13 [Perca fluviatilis]|uniref:toll-like receptor 13 n=1 Tax=Perca fluviatilis TaxID=8168 RepID=UPI0019631038|nr:toll-like receptor 13 [Perca fluviatilis]
MQYTGSWPLFLVPLLSFLLHYNPLLAFSLKNCTIDYSEDANELSVTCERRSLTAIPDDIPRNASSLDLNSNSISKITGTDLKYLPKLTYASLGFNLISHIDDGAFADLEKLKVLFLSNNNLTKVTDNMFQGLSKLVKLFMDVNRISYISPVAFQSLVSLEELDLGSNYLQQIADVAPIFKLPTLNKLSLENNKFTSFQSDDLPLNISKIKTLYLTMNPLRKFSLTKDVFPHLRSLQLSNCSSSDMEWDVSNKTFLRNLTSLSLGGSYISFELCRMALQTTESLQTLFLTLMKARIDEGLIDVACQIQSLRTLYLVYNHIVSVDDNLLKSCSQITDLSLSSNKLSEMSEHSLRFNSQLRHLDLGGNQLSKVPLALRGLSTLETLDLSYNDIAELDCNTFLNLTRLTTLNLYQNRISKIKGCVFQNLNDLIEVNIGENAVFTFDNTFKVGLQKLESLNLNNNRLLHLMSEDFSNLSSLRSLDLENYKCYNVNERAFQGLDNLQTLIITPGNYRKEMFIGLAQLENLTLHLTAKWELRSSQQNDYSPFSNLPNLKKLILKDYDIFDAQDITQDLLKGLKSLEFLTSDNFFKKSLHPDTFKHTPRLKVLQIINSDLSHLTPELFWQIPNLQKLDLSNNKLRYLDFLGGANLLTLRWLKLIRNELSLINETALQCLPALTYLDLNNNPLTCECSNIGFNQWVQSNNQTQVVNGHQYTCAFPVSQKGNKFLDFDTSSCWIDPGFFCFIFSTFFILFTLLTSFIYHFLRWHLAYAYYLFLAFVYDKRSRRKGSPHHYDAFVSYNVYDEAWVYEEMLPVLEGEQGWRLCLHHRDFEPGKPIVENITDAIYGSRKTICVISRHYLQSEWCSREIQMASYRLFDEQDDVLILLFMEDIPACELSLYYRMRSLVKRRTYLSWPQAGQHTGVFWQNIRRSLMTPGSPTDNPIRGFFQNQE